MEPRAAVREALERGERAALVTVTGLEGSPPSREGMALGVLETGARFGSLGCDGFDESGEHDAMRALREHVRLERTYDWDDTSRVRVEVRPFAPGETVPGSTARPELIVIGTGPVARALAAIGKVLGFTIRAVSLGPSDAPDPDERVVVRSVAELIKLHLGPESYVVIAGHDREFSQEALRMLLRSDAPYLGMMGSRRHTGGLLDELRTGGISDRSLARVHTPVGLDLGAQTPEEIALAAIAQIVAVRRGRSGAPLA
ncbi:MAG: XdhC/CoxI family protein [Chloroflexota bacterium]|nr:XdhC/CoxI family protein [Chloroflexota bacterium]